MAFIYDINQMLEKKINIETVIYQSIETKFWKNFLKNLVEEHLIETDSRIAKKILNNFKDEIKHFYQVCPKEMLSKLKNPISENNINIAG